MERKRRFAVWKTDFSWTLPIPPATTSCRGRLEGKVNWLAAFLALTPRPDEVSSPPVFPSQWWQWRVEGMSLHGWWRCVCVWGGGGAGELKIVWEARQLILQST